MNDEEAIEYLSNLRQIGRWSAEMILLFTFNRQNIWPIQDIGLLRAISNNYKKKYLPPKNFIFKLQKKFSPFQNNKRLCSSLWAETNETILNNKLRLGR